MVVATESETCTMQLETPDTIAFQYPESPQRKHFSVVEDSEPLRFPEAGWSEGHKPSTAPSEGECGSGVVTQNYDYGIEPGFPSMFPLDEGIKNSGHHGDSAGDSVLNPERDSAPETRDQLLRQLLAAESIKAEERGRAAGMEEGIAQGIAQGIGQGIILGREEAARQLQGERERLVARAATLLEDFSGERESYFLQIQQEAVRLALAIAARILRREARTDPLLLTGAVRVTLGQLASSTSVRLHVPLADQPMWEEAMARIPGLPLRPQVIGDAGMELGDCRMETDLGCANLGLWPQLKVIERGFFERTEDRGINRPEDAQHASEAGNTEASYTEVGHTEVSHTEASPMEVNHDA